jgi:macrolide transport system ATP-binding/permease protein
MWARFSNRLRFLFRRDRFDRELAEEMEFHRAMLAAEKAREGLDPEAAAASARRQLGNTTLAAEQARDVWLIAWLDSLGSDLRYALRAMAASKTFAALAVLSIALGIGATAAIYSFMDSLLLRSLPIPDPESLVILNWHAKQTGRDFVMLGMSGTTYEDPKRGVTAGIFPFPALELFQQYDSVFSTVFAHCQGWQVRRPSVTVDGHADIATGWNVSGGYFGGLGIAPAAGRLILPDDDRPGAPAVAVVSYGFSRRRFGGAENAAGHSILVDNLPFTVVGVTPPEFFGVDPAASPDLYLPMHTNELLGAGKPFGFQPEDYLARNYYWIQVMARLRPGVSRAQAEATLAPAFQRWVAGTATTDEQRANLPALRVEEGAGGLDSLRRQYSQPLLVLMTLVGLILGLTCANVANLLLARGTARRREIALRLSIGAGRSRIVRQLMTESLLLASLGGVLGVLFAISGVRFLTVLLACGRPDFTLRAELNWHVLGVAAALSLVTGVLFGLAPALQTTRVDLMPALQARRTSNPRAGYRSRSVGSSRPLIVSQIAISLLMLVAAGLFLRTLSNLESIALGFNHENLLLFQVDARKAGHTDPEITSFYADLRDRFGAIPGVRSASLERSSMLQGEHGLPIGVAGSPPNPANRFLTVGPAFFATMEIPIRAGRDFGESDRREAPAVAVVNEVFARENFGDRDPLGQRLILRQAGEAGLVARDMEIIGVSRNARYGGLTRAIPPVVYIPFDQGYPQPDQMVYVLRTVGDPLRYVEPVREVVRRADARIPVADVRTQSAEIETSIGQQIAFARLCTGFAILALAIAGVGLYGTVSYDVARRTGEIGVRMALGAPRGGVVRMVLREVLVLVATGLAIGMIVALATSRFVASFLYGMRANDPLTFSLAVTLLLGSALLAAYAPARRASRIDPATALRHE